MQKGGTSSLPPFLQRFRGSEKTGRNQQKFRCKKNLLQLESANTYSQKSQRIITLQLIPLAIAMQRSREPGMKLRFTRAATRKVFFFNRRGRIKFNDA
jgi:hypothetical protein